MKNDYLIQKTLETFKRCNTRSFPFDCRQALQEYGYRVFTYQELGQRNPELYELCISCSEEAYSDAVARIVAYNNTRPWSRIRFSLAHELGHIVLEHMMETAANETAANTFASHVLAPRIAIHHAKCANHAEVARIFELSLEAADYAFQDYRRWRRMASYRISPVHQDIYDHFYDSKVEAFVFRVRKCAWCNTLLYNEPEKYECPLCAIPRYSYSRDPLDDALSPEARIMGKDLAGY